MHCHLGFVARCGGGEGAAGVAPASVLVLRPPQCALFSMPYHQQLQPHAPATASGVEPAEPTRRGAFGGAPTCTCTGGAGVVRVWPPPLHSQGATSQPGCHITNRTQHMANCTHQAAMSPCHVTECGDDGTPSLCAKSSLGNHPRQRWRCPVLRCFVEFATDYVGMQSYVVRLEKDA